MKKLAIVLLLTAGLSGQEQNSDLARVTILSFADETGSQGYRWMKKSLPDSIESSMKSRFEFSLVQNEKTSAVDSSQLLQGKKPSLEKLEEVSKLLGTDIIIFGNYFQDTDSQTIKIKAFVYHREGNRLIGTADAQSPLNNTIFSRVDLISGQIVQHIYNFALQFEEEEKQRNLRVMVLVPNWKTKAEYQQATQEMKLMKFHMSKKYNARFITMNEFFEEKETAQSERDKVLAMAQKNDKKGITSWLAEQGVKDAFIVLVASSRVVITPVVEGKEKKVSSYSVNDSPKKKYSQMENASKKAGMNLPTRGKITSRLKRNIFMSKIWSAHLSGSFGVPVTGVSKYLKNSFGGKANIHGNLFLPWLYPYFQFSMYVDPGSSSEFQTRFFQLAGGLAYPVWSTKTMSLKPFVAIGVAGGNIKGINEATDKGFALPAIDAGLIFDYYLLASLSLSYQFATSFHLDKNLPTLMLQNYLGFGYHF